MGGVASATHLLRLIFIPGMPAWQETFGVTARKLAFIAECDVQGQGSTMDCCA